MTDHKNHTKETIYNDTNMKHGTNSNITNTVYKKKKQTHPHHVYTKTIILFTPNETKHYYVHCKQFYGNQDTNRTNRTNTNNK